MIALEMRLVSFAHDSQHRRYRVLARGQNGPGNQHVDMRKYPFGKQGRKAYNHLLHGGRQRNHDNLLLAEEGCQYTTAFRGACQRSFNG
jgi:hypothetical protein